MGTEIFRKVSMERLSSPEQLDVLMKVTSPIGWLSLLSVGFVLAVALFWGFYGSIATTVAGRGILVKTGGVLDVESSASGQITAYTRAWAMSYQRASSWPGWRSPSSSRP